MNEFVFAILKCLVAVCAALISAYLVPYIRRLAQNEKYKAVVDMVETAVMAAEKVVKGDGKGKEKKEMVLEYCLTWLGQHGIRITEEQLDALIEAAVYELC